MSIRTYHSFDELEANTPSLVTIGTFDGVHCGHQVIINKLIELSKSSGLSHLVVTFEPHPQIVLNKGHKSPVYLLTTIEQRIEQLERFGVERVLVVNFTEEFSKIAPRDFVEKCLIEKATLKTVLVGYDHLFGASRQGDKELLVSLGEIHGFDVVQIEAQTRNETVVSSTKIRNYLAEGKVAEANALLGYHYYIDGLVVVGDKRGRTLGFPTANVGNINPNKLMPRNGVYLTKCQVAGKSLYGMANIGLRPTFLDTDKPLLEVNLFDFDGDIYGQPIKVSFVHYLREEKKFSGIEEIVAQIKKDEIECRKIINEKPLKN